MNVPINRLIKSSVEVGHLAYDTNRPDMKKGKTCVTNHYKIFGDYILPLGQALTHNQNGATDNAAAEEIGVLTSKIVKPQVTLPASMPKGSTHLRIK